MTVKQSKEVQINPDYEDGKYRVTTTLKGEELELFITSQDEGKVVLLEYGTIEQLTQLSEMIQKAIEKVQII